MSDNSPLISIIILNYNQLKVTREFLESCRALQYPNYEIILVDNASNDNPEKLIMKKYPDVVFIRNKENLGFTTGNNVGIKAAKGEYFFIVNNDTEVTPDLLDLLLQPFQEDSSIGMVSPKIKYFDNPEMIQYAGYTEINPITGRNKTIGIYEIDHGQYNTSGYTKYAHGAAMLVKREIVETVGMFADVFFIYYEELDWSARVRKAGYTIYYQSAAEIFHKESITMGKESAIKAYYHNRNRVLFMRRNTEPFQFLLFCTFFLMIICPKQILSYIVKGQHEHLKNFFKGIKWNINHLFINFE